MSYKLSPYDILLLILYADNQTPIIGKTKIQKIIFLYEEELHKKLNFHKTLTANESLFNFTAYNYGPFSKKMVLFINALYKLKYIEIFDTNTKNHDDELIEGYKITELGKEYLKSKIFDFIDEIKFETISQFKNKYNSMGHNELLRYVYTQYEESTENSLIKNQILGK